jgi:hypothetical protein
MAGAYSKRKHKKFMKKMGFSGSDIQYIPRQKKSTRRKPAKNPRQLLFRTKKAAVKYARAHGAKKFSVRKLKRAR